MVTEIIKKRIPFLFFCIIYSVVILRIYTDFGVAIDEPIEYRFGEMLYARNFGKDSILLRDFAIEQSNSREIWAYNHFHAMLLFMINDSSSLIIYHLLNFGFGLFGLYVVYEIVLHTTKKPFVGLLGSLILLFTPRFFGDLASNLKDPVFAIYSLAVVLSMLWTQKMSNLFLRAIVIGIPLGFAAASRTVGYSLILGYGLYLLIQQFQLFKASIRKLPSLFIECFTLLIITVLVHAIQMPFVARDPMRHLIRLMEVARAYPWDGPMLYLGSTVTALNKPWHYLPVWIGITTPLFILIFWLLSHRFVLKNKTILLMNILVWVNIVLYYVIHPIIYDGTRHYLFIVVFMAVVALITWYEMWSSGDKYKKIILTILLSLNLISIADQYRLLHPYEYVYFNELVGYLPGAFGKFETDYWGTSYFEGSRCLKGLVKESPVLVGICGNKEAAIYFENTSIKTIWLPFCQIDPKNKPDFLFVMGRNEYWNMYKGSADCTVSRMGIPLMKVLNLRSYAVQ